MEGLTTYTLGELSINGKGSYGIGAPAVDFSKNKYMYLRITDINDDGTLSTSDRKSVDDPEAHKYVLHKNDIVFARTGNSTGRAYFYDERDGELVYAGFLIKFSLDPTKVNPKVLKYYTHSKPYYDWVKSFDTGATRGNINAQTFASMPITLPDKETQDRIVDILSAIDNKIRLNNRINHNLEDQAQALYKSYFVDFEPFKGGKFVDSELGMIPEGWRVAELGTVTRQNSQKVKDRIDVKVLSPVTTGELVLSEEYFTKQVFSESISKYLVVKPLHFAYNPARVNIGSIGMNMFSFDGCVSPVYVVFECEKGYHHFFDYYRKTESFKDEVLNRAIGGVRQTLSYKDFALIKLVYPPYDIVEKFNCIYAGLLENKNSIKREISKLSELRDTLLPKLLSGELKIDDFTC